MAPPSNSQSLVSWKPPSYEVNNSSVEIGLNRGIVDICLTIEEENWTTQLNFIIQDIAKEVSLDEQQLDLMISYRQGNLKQKRKLAALSGPLLVCRTNKLLDNLLGTVFKKKTISLQILEQKQD